MANAMHSATRRLEMVLFISIIPFLVFFILLYILLPILLVLFVLLAIISPFRKANMNFLLLYSQMVAACHIRGISL